MNKIFTHSANCTMYVDKFRRFIKHIDLDLGPINRTNDENSIARMQISCCDTIGVISEGAMVPLR